MCVLLCVFTACVLGDVLVLILNDISPYLFVSNFVS